MHQEPDWRRCPTRPKPTQITPRWNTEWIQLNMPNMQLKLKWIETETTLTMTTLTTLSLCLLWLLWLLWLGTKAAQSCPKHCLIRPPRQPWWRSGRCSPGDWQSLEVPVDPIDPSDALCPMCQALGTRPKLEAMPWTTSPAKVWRMLWCCDDVTKELDSTC